MKNQALPTKNQAGNVFLIILLGIALFAALSYAVTKGLRGGSAKMTEESARLAATEMLAYAETVRNAYKTMLIGGTPIEQISFDMETMVLVNGTASDYSTPACTTNKCKIFHPSGGNVKEQMFFEHGAQASWASVWSARAGGSDFFFASIKDIGTDKSDIVMLIVQIKPEICHALNAMIGHPNATIRHDSGSPTFYGVYGDIADKMQETDMYRFGNTYPEAAGKTHFCTTDDFNGHFLIHAR